MTVLVVLIDLIPKIGVLTEGVDRSFNLTAEITSGLLGFDVIARIFIIPGGTAKSILMHDTFIVCSICYCI